MSKLRELVSPYSFRAKTQVYLLISVITACFISLIGAYAYSSFLVRK